MVLGLEKIEHIQNQLEALARTVASLESELKSIKADIIKLQRKHKED